MKKAAARIIWTLSDLPFLNFDRKDNKEQLDATSEVKPNAKIVWIPFASKKAASNVIHKNGELFWDEEKHTTRIEKIIP